jgi:hypothetical protein
MLFFFYSFLRFNDIYHCAYIVHPSRTEPHDSLVLLSFPSLLMRLMVVVVSSAVVVSRMRVLVLVVLLLL